jgi:hypothetical protein
MVPSVASGAFLVPNHARSPRSTLDGIRTSENTKHHTYRTLVNKGKRKGRAAVDTIW